MCTPRWARLAAGRCRLESVDELLLNKPLWCVMPALRRVCWVSHEDTPAAAAAAAALPVRRA